MVQQVNSDRIKIITSLYVTMHIESAVLTQQVNSIDFVNNTFSLTLLRCNYEDYVRFKELYESECRVHVCILDNKICNAPVQNLNLIHFQS